VAEHATAENSSGPSIVKQTMVAGAEVACGDDVRNCSRSDR